MTDDFMDPGVGERLARAARAAQTLSEALWEALHEELGAARSDRVAELSERLSEVSVTVASLARGGTVGATGEEAPVAVPAPGAFPAADRDTESLHERPLGPERLRGEAGSRGRGFESGPTRAREHRFSERFTPAPAVSAPPASGASASPPPEKPIEAVLVDERASPPEIEIKDERRELARTEEALPGERPQLQWIASIERRLERYERDRLPFAVMLVELVDIERLRHAELPNEMARMTGSVETALSDELRPADSLMRESPGRYWLLAPETDPAGARMLAERLSQAVRGVAGHRGVSLEIAVGIAVCPTDGNEAVGLAARADIALYAARAAGRPIAP